MDALVSRLGNTVQGHVLDVSRKPFEVALRRLDSRLYLKWNPTKNAGNGLWEIRIRPTKLTSVYKTTYQGAKVFSLEYVENNLTHHVLDVMYLNYNVLVRLDEMDSTKRKNWVDSRDYEAEKLLERQQSQQADDLKHLIHENRKYFADLKEYVSLGYNPAWFFSNHNK